ncbi:MAG: TetR/AcrR family transcriptional regulator [Streptosporangiales bacterium]
MSEPTDEGKQRPEARRRLLDAADRLFYAHGINATGVDAVIEAADVARMTFYKHFHGKDALIAAYLEGRDLRWRLTFEEAVTAAGDDPRARLLAIFDALKLWSSEPRYRGCSFANAAAELADSHHPARDVVSAHKHAMRQRLADLAHAANVADPKLVVDQLLMLFEGAITTTALGTVDEATDKARATAQQLLAFPR